MYSRASDGHEPNNFLFSPCSKQEISPVISSKGQECFIAHSSGSYCGNKIVEEGEDCDCGRPEECLEVDKCCVARDDALNIPGCTVKQGEQCRCVSPRMYNFITSSLQIIIIVIIIIIIITLYTIITMYWVCTVLLQILGSI
ncbi:disintegrin and metalloproteinase domain-containing protein 10-like [Orbicella faveolata]|uniref:disintegrin and metalloproteinase domain-containing protein 10-like n=1 Tax=Orbicella faveolata TaxID=48498 RepID=UPI0009E362B9|nr:disintegrin and metalloproteinase domain-containing protein 10-like [Orbicella faveolata]